MKTWKTNGVPLRNRQIHGEFTVIPSSENMFVAVIVERHLTRTGKCYCYCCCYYYYIRLCCVQYASCHCWKRVAPMTNVEIPTPSVFKDSAAVELDSSISPASVVSLLFTCIIVYNSLLGGSPMRGTSYLATWLTLHFRPLTAFKHINKIDIFVFPMFLYSYLDGQVHMSPTQPCCMSHSALSLHYK